MERGLTVSRWALDHGYNINTVWSVLGRMDEGRTFKEFSISNQIAVEITKEMGEEK
jgi:hypothetical protein